MKNQPPHTPIPWRTASDELGYFRCVEKDDRLIARLPSVDSLQAERDAAYIVRAVNAHEELLDACKKAAQWMTDNSIVGKKQNETFYALRDAIAKVEQG